MVSPIFTSPVAAGANGPRPICTVYTISHVFCTVYTISPRVFWSHVSTSLTFSDASHKLKLETKSVFITSCCCVNTLKHNVYHIYHQPYGLEKSVIKEPVQSNICHTNRPWMEPETR
jgi:hypothetical protein